MPNAKSIRLPVKKSDDILLDSMIIHEILVGDAIVKKLQKRLREYDSKLILLDRVVEETANMEKTEYEDMTKYTKDEIKDKIEEAVKKIGPYEKIKVNYAHPEIMVAIYRFHDKENLSFDYDDLSKVDFILLQVHVTQALLTRPASLLTHENVLERVAKSEGRRTMPVSYTWKTIYRCPGCHTEHRRGFRWKFKKETECPNCGTQLKKTEGKREYDF